jgi:hypothetical protein
MIGMIPNSRFNFVKHPGSGNKSCKVAQDEKLRLSNILISRADADEFLKVLYATGEKQISVEISDRRTSKRWGTAWTYKRKVIIYRHTVWVFLHELAHILDVKQSFATGLAVASCKPHGHDFGSHLSCMYEIWMENCDKGIVNTPQKDAAPDTEFDAVIPKKWAIPPLRPRTVGGISLQVGDGVWFLGRGRKIIARVLRVNKKSCRVKPIDGSSEWRVSPKLLNKTDLPEKPIVPETPVKKRSLSDQEILNAWKAKFRK